MNVNQIYETIRPLPVVERLRLATLILNDISPQCIVDYNEEWSEEDYRDFNKTGWGYIDKRLEEAENA